MMVICIKQRLSNIWSSIYEKFKQHWGYVEKKHCLYKKRMYLFNHNSLNHQTWLIDRYDRYKQGQ